MQTRGFFLRHFSAIFQLSCMLSVDAISFEDRFCASKKGEVGRGGRVSAQGIVHMVVALASCRTALVSTNNEKLQG